MRILCEAQLQFNGAIYLFFSIVFIAAAEPSTVNPVTVGAYVFIPFAIFVIVLLLIIVIMLLLSITHKK